MYLNYKELDADIIIIGAGITGLSSAYFLLQKDPHLDFIIIDVDDKNGNSSFLNVRPKLHKQTTFSDEEYKLRSRQFVCLEQKKLMKLLESLKIPIEINDGNIGKVLVDYDDIYEVSGRKNVFDFISSADSRILSKVCSHLDNLSQKVSFEDPRRDIDMLEYDEISMEAFLKTIVENKRVRDIIAQTFLLNCGLHPRDVSALFFLAYCNSTQGIQNQFHENKSGMYQFYIQDGADAIKSSLIDVVGEESIVKVSGITEICWDDYSAGVKTPNEDYFANKVIYTMAEGETKKIKFVPPLSDKRMIISNNIARGKLKKFVVSYDKPFWLSKKLSGNIYVMNTESRNGPIQICLNITEKDEYTLTGLANQESKKSQILEQLAFYLGSEALNAKYYEENISSFFELSFPHGFVRMNGFGNIRENLERIVWASPETATNWYGTVAGSCEAGFQAAFQVIYDAKPNMLSINDIDIVNPFEVYIPPRRTEVFGIKWHILLPTILFAIIVVRKVRNYMKGKTT